MVPNFFGLGKWRLEIKEKSKSRQILQFCPPLSYFTHPVVPRTCWVRSATFTGSGHLHFLGQRIYIFWFTQPYFFWIMLSSFFWLIMCFFGSGCFNFWTQFIFIFGSGCLNFFGQVVLIVWVRLSSIFGSGSHHLLGQGVFIFSVRLS